MYTQCPECGTVFRLSADALRVAQGDVRCGICSTVFSAIGSLSDDPTSRLAHSAPAEDTMTVEEVSGSEIIELGAQGQALPRQQPPADDEAWPRDPALDGGPPAASDDLVPDSGGAREAGGDPQAIEVSIADAEVAAMLEASGTWERLRVNSKAPDGRAGAVEPVEAVSPAAESMAESMAASANAATGTFSGRMKVLELVAASEQITLESPPDGKARTPRTGDGPAATAAEPGPDDVGLDELDAALQDYLDAEQPAEVPPDLTARLQPEPLPELATHGAISLPESQEFELPLDVDTGEFWDDELDEAAVAMREREIEALAAQLAEAPVTSPAAGARRPAAAIAPPPPEPTMPAAPEPAAASPVEPASDPGDIQRAVEELVAAVGTTAAPAGSSPERIDLDATDEFPILVLDESDEDDAAIEARVAASRLLAALDDAPPVGGGAAAAEPLEPAHAAEAPATPLAPEAPATPLAPEAPATSRAVDVPEPVVAGSDAEIAAVTAPTDTDRFVGDTVAAAAHEPARDAEPPQADREAGGAPATEAPLQILIPPELRAAYAPSAQRQAEEELADLSFAAERPRAWPWTLAALLLVLALGVQVLHVNRDRVAADPTYGPWLARAYAIAGLRLETPVDLGAFELRQWGAASDALSRDRLRFRASIVNRAAHPQRFPLLRLSLQDRFGNLVGTRDALPQEYLRGTAPAAPEMLPGQRVDAELVVVDPGEDAVGFELELCVPAGAGLRCAKDPGGS